MSCKVDFTWIGNLETLKFKMLRFRVQRIWSHWRVVEFSRFFVRKTFMIHIIHLTLESGGVQGRLNLSLKTDLVLSSKATGGENQVWLL